MCIAAELNVIYIKNMSKIIEMYSGSKYYSDFFDSFTHDIKNNIKFDNESKEISEAIFLHICRMKYAGWRHRINFKRKKKHSLSEIFQDVIAFYLKSILPCNYEVILEERIQKTQPDIAIKWNNKFFFLIEVKTNLGWARPDQNKTDPFEGMRNRIFELSKNFEVDKNNIIYILEEHSNVNKTFSSMFWDKDNKRAKNRPTLFPYSVIYPLFNAIDPYYWKHEKGFDKTKGYIELSSEQIREKAKFNIVTPIEMILKKIIDATPKQNR